MKHGPVVYPMPHIAYDRNQLPSLPGIPGYGFGGPNLTTPGQIGMNTSATFGMLNTTTEQTAAGGNTNVPRYLQVSLRLYF